MSAATQDINTPERAGVLVSLPVAASTTIYAGSLVAVNGSGYAVPASDAAGLAVVGRAEEQADNSAGSAGDVSITVKRGVFRFANSGSHALTKSNIGEVAYVEDDNTIGSDGGTNNIVAGVVEDVDDDGVWVNTASRAKFAATAVTLGNANGEIAAIALATETSTDGTAGACTEVGPLAAEAEKIGDDVRDVRAKFATLVTKCEELADDVRAIKAALDAQGITS